MADAPDIQNEQPIVPPATPTWMQVKGQVRLIVAALAGALILHKVVPDWLLNDQLIDLVVGAIMFGLMAAWSWVRTKFIHGLFLDIARSPDVPSSIAKPANGSNPPNI